MRDQGIGARIGPSEQDPPLIVDADRELTRQIALESFKAIAGRSVQGLKNVGGVHHNQFSASCLGEIRRETLRDDAALKNRLGGRRERYTKVPRSRVVG